MPKQHLTYYNPQDSPYKQFVTIADAAFERTGYSDSGKLRILRIRILMKYLELSFDAAIHGYQIRLSKMISLIPVILVRLTNVEYTIPGNKQSSRFPELGFDIIIQQRYTIAKFTTRLYRKWYDKFRKVYESDLVYELIRKKL